MENVETSAKEEKGTKFRLSDKIKIPKNFKENKKLTIIIAIIVVLVVIIGAICIINLSNTSNNVGNTIGNIRNYGYGVSDGKWIYYLSPSEDGSKVGIYKIKNRGDKKEKVLMEDFDIYSINLYKNYIYFVGKGLEAYSDTDKVDNKIYKMKKDGSDLKVINDNEFHNECYEIYVVKDSVYYIGVDQNIYKMKLDGTDRKLVSENGTGYIGITDKYIIYNMRKEDSSDEYVTYIMNLDGTNQRPLIEGQRLYSVDIKGKYVYYANENKQICRTKIDSGKEELILDTTAYNLNLKNNYLYFLNYLDPDAEERVVCLYRIKADGSQKEAENIKTLSTYSSYINVVGDWVMYLDYDETSGFINLVNANGNGKEKQVYILKYEDYSSTISSEETNTEVPTEETNVDVNTNTTANEVSTNEVATNTVQ